jgi:cell division protein FtsB
MSSTYVAMLEAQVKNLFDEREKLLYDLERIEEDCEELHARNAVLCSQVDELQIENRSLRKDNNLSKAMDKLEID